MRTLVLVAALLSAATVPSYQVRIAGRWVTPVAAVRTDAGWVRYWLADGTHNVVPPGQFKETMSSKPREVAASETTSSKPREVAASGRK